MSSIKPLFISRSVLKTTFLVKEFIFDYILFGLMRILIDIAKIIIESFYVIGIRKSTLFHWTIKYLIFRNTMNFPCNNV